jgi:hypothetical protein
MIKNITIDVLWLKSKYSIGYFHNLQLVSKKWYFAFCYQSITQKIKFLGIPGQYFYKHGDI